MHRRTLLTTVALIATSGCVAVNTETAEESTPDSDPDTVDVDDAPEIVRELEALAVAFAEEIDRYYPDSRVFISPDQEIILEHVPQTDSESTFESRIHQIADLYAETIEDHEVVPLVIMSDEVQVVVPKAPLEQYASGELETDAFHETIAYTEAPR